MAARWGLGSTHTHDTHVCTWSTTLVLVDLEPRRLVVVVVV